MHARHPFVAVAAAANVDTSLPTRARGPTNTGQDVTSSLVRTEGTGSTNRVYMSYHTGTSCPHSLVHFRRMTPLQCTALAPIRTPAGACAPRPCPREPLPLPFPPSSAKMPRRRRGRGRAACSAPARAWSHAAGTGSSPADASRQVKVASHARVR
jgi:hypothetical protein